MNQAVCLLAYSSFLLADAARFERASTKFGVSDSGQLNYASTKNKNPSVSAGVNLCYLLSESVDKEGDRGTPSVPPHPHPPHLSELLHFDDTPLDKRVVCRKLARVSTANFCS